MAAIYLHPAAIHSPRTVARIEMLTGMRALWVDGRRAELCPERELSDATSPAPDYTGEPEPPRAA